MIFTNVVDRNIYLSFNDLEKDVIKNISNKLSKTKIDKEVIKEIISFIKISELDDNFKRQKRYLSNLSTYIDVIDNKYNLFIFILPKEIELSNYQGMQKEDIFKNIERLSINIFKLYDEHINKKEIEFKKLLEYKGESFLEWELVFYINELNNLYNHLLNYKRNLKNKIICSYKQVGISVESLNILEKNPLNNYQFVKISHQEDLVIFIYSLIEFLQNKRLDIFKKYDNYKEIVKITNKIYNFLRKISTSKIIKKEKVNEDNLKSYFIKYKNLKEIQKNIIIFDIAKKIFHNQLHDGVFLYKTIDLTKMFEGVVEIKLKNYKDKLYIGDENAKKIQGITDLNDINYLLCHKNKIKQYPDFLIQKDDIFHIVDAKYKLYNNIFKSRDIFWQILIYAKLFNKKLPNLEKVEKVIIYPNKMNIDIFQSFEIKLNKDVIDISQDGELINENVFDTAIRLIEVDIFNAYKRTNHE